MCVCSSLSFLDHWHWCNWWVYWEGKSSFADMWCLPLFLWKVGCLRLRDKQCDTLKPLVFWQVFEDVTTKRHLSKSCSHVWIPASDVWKTKVWSLCLWHRHGCNHQRNLGHHAVGAAHQMARKDGWNLWNYDQEARCIRVFPKMVVPQIIHFNRVFHYKPSILGYPYFWKHPYTDRWVLKYNVLW